MTIQVLSTTPTQGVIINTSPKVGFNLQLFFIYLDSNGNLAQANIRTIDVLYGSASINLSTNSIIPLLAEQLSIYVTAITSNGILLNDIFYCNPINQITIPNNQALHIQNYPKGVFDSFGSDTVIGAITSAVGGILDDYYINYISVNNEFFNGVYSPQSEYEFNNTVGILSSSVYPNELMLLLQRLGLVKLTTYCLELFISQYIYYRLGTQSAVYIDDGIINPDVLPYWIIDKSELTVNTELAPNGYTPVVSNLAWTIYNSINFTNQFKQEITNLVNRIGRCDVGNPITFSNIVNPTLDNFKQIGYVYEGDPSMLYGSCLQYLGDNVFPLNVTGFIKLPPPSTI